MNNKPFNAGLAFSEFRVIRVFYIIAAMTAFFMSAYFVVGYFAGNLHVLEWDYSQWAQALPSIGLVAVMTAYQFVLYSQGDTEGGKKATIIAVCVAVAFSLLSEIGQGMERDHIRMETKSQDSPTYKAALAALGNLSGGNIGASPYAADIANAQMKFNQCMERLANGKEPHCEGSKGRLASYQQQEAAWMQRASDTSTNTATALLDKTKTLEKDESNYHPLVSLIRETFSSSGTVASFLLSLTLISFFEYAFHYLGGRYAATKDKLMQHGYDITRRLRQPPRKHDGSMDTYSDKATTAPLSAFAGAADATRQTVAEYAEKAAEKAGEAIRNAPEAIATEYAKAQHAREQVYQKAADTLDKLQPPSKPVGKTLEQIEQDKPVVMSHKPLEPFRSADDTLLQPPASPAPRMSVAATIRAIIDSVQASGATSPAAVQAATQAAYSKLFNPADLDAHDLQKIAAKIVTDLKPAVTGFAPEPARPAQQQTGATGLQNPALGTAEEQYSLPMPIDPDTLQDAPPKPYAQGLQDGSQNPMHRVLESPAKPQARNDGEGLDSLYRTWVSAVRARECRPSAEASRAWIQKRIAPSMTGSKTNDLKRIAAMQQAFFARAISDGLMSINPNYTNGGKKYIWIG
ncbi:MAG: hypothetical protein JG718_11380 [Candidatus Thiothrix moscowensis]|nr:hypothetical protein [Candidatus Thiothrix moscowensis]